MFVSSFDQINAKKKSVNKCFTELSWAVYADLILRPWLHICWTHPRWLFTGLSYLSLHPPPCRYHLCVFVCLIYCCYQERILEVFQCDEAAAALDLFYFLEIKPLLECVSSTFQLSQHRFRRAPLPHGSKGGRCLRLDSCRIKTEGQCSFLFILFCMLATLAWGPATYWFPQTFHLCCTGSCADVWHICPAYVDNFNSSVGAEVCHRLFPQ